MQQAKINDRDYWARVHIVSDRSKPVELPDRPRSVGRVFSMWPAHRKQSQPEEK